MTSREVAKVSQRHRSVAICRDCSLSPPVAFVKRSRTRGGSGATLQGSRSGRLHLFDILNAVESQDISVSEAEVLLGSHLRHTGLILEVAWLPMRMILMPDEGYM